MHAETLIIFRAEINAQLRQLEIVFDRIEQRAGATSESEVESLAYQLHNLYCAFEDLFELVAERFENHLEHDAKIPHGITPTDGYAHRRCSAGVA